MNCHFLFITQTCKTQMIKQFKWRYSFSILTYSMQTKSCFVYSAQWCFSKWARLILAVMISLGSAQAEQLALKAMRILNKFMHCCCLLSICFFKKKIHALLMGLCLARRTSILREWRRYKTCVDWTWSGERESPLPLKVHKQCSEVQ